jgi:pimeloyl-ACP methyl ester carboxylesterase
MKLKMKLGTLVTLIACSVAAKQNVEASSFNFTATNLSFGATCTINVQVLENTNAPVNGKVLMGAAGLLHSAAALKPFAAEVFSSPLYSSTVRIILLVDYPGHGESGLPFGAQFGQMSLADYAKVEIQAIQQSSARGMSPSALYVHSMAGLVTQLAGSLQSLAALGITDVILDGSSQSREVPDPILNTGFGLGLLGAYTYYNTVQGTNAQITPYLFVGFFFTDANDQLLPGAPFPGQIMAFGYKSDESYVAALETLGPDDMRPSVTAGIFSPANGINLRVIVGAQDRFSDIDQQKAMYRYLSGAIDDNGVYIVDGPHDHVISNPADTVDVLGLSLGL